MLLLSCQAQLLEHSLQRPAQILISLVFSLLLSQQAYAEDFLKAQSEFDQFKTQSDRDFERSKNEFTIYKQKLLTAFDQYKLATAKVWGNKNTVMPNRNNWVSYQDDLNHRSVVDFNRGTIQVDLALAADKNISADDATRQLADSIVKTLKLGNDTRSMLDIAKQPIAVSKGPAVLAGQIANQQGSEVSRDDYRQLAQQAAIAATTKIIKGNDGQRRIVYSAQLKMVPNHLRKRAARYQADVNKYAQKEKVPAPVVFAIMETESMFNPTARSPVPAFGLMQLVPTSGARDAYRYLYKKDRVVSDTYLYHPGNNIKLGTAYLNQLYYKYLAGISNPQSRQWAMIAAYNTGAGNVFRAFAGKYSKSRYGNRSKWKRAALREINQRSPEQVYTYLRQHLPYSETRRYMKKVRGRISKYQTAQGV